MSPELELLAGRITDAEYFSAIAAGVPRPGWRHRQARIRRAVLEILTLATSILMLIFILWVAFGGAAR